MGTAAARHSFAEDLPLTRRAIEFAERAHRDQIRETDQAPFVVHLVEVAALLDAEGFPDEVVAAGVLHDVLERTDVGIDELASTFGPRPAALVATLTEDPAIAGLAERKRALREQVAAAPPEAAAIFAADKLARVEELRAHLAAAGSVNADTAVKVAHYRASLTLLELMLPASPLVSRLRAALEALRTLAPASSASF